MHDTYVSKTQNKKLQKLPVTISKSDWSYHLVTLSFTETKGWLSSGVVSVLDRTAWVQIAVTTLSGDSLRQIVHTHRASVHQATKLVAAILRVAGQLQAWQKVMAAYLRVYDSPLLQADCQEPGSAPEPYTR